MAACVPFEPIELSCLHLVYMLQLSGLMGLSSFIRFFFFFPSRLTTVCSIQRGKHDLHLDQSLSDTHSLRAAQYLSAILSNAFVSHWHLLSLSHKHTRSHTHFRMKDREGRQPTPFPQCPRLLSLDLIWLLSQEISIHLFFSFLAVRNRLLQVTNGYRPVPSPYTLRLCWNGPLRE